MESWNSFASDEGIRDEVSVVGWSDEMLIIQLSLRLYVQ